MILTILQNHSTKVGNWAKQINKSLTHSLRCHNVSFFPPSLHFMHWFPCKRRQYRGRGWRRRNFLWWVKCWWWYRLLVCTYSLVLPPVSQPRPHSHSHLTQRKKKNVWRYLMCKWMGRECVKACRIWKTVLYVSLVVWWRLLFFFLSFFFAKRK